MKLQERADMYAAFVIMRFKQTNPDCENIELTLAIMRRIIAKAFMLGYKKAKQQKGGRYGN